ncbi:hypothetical protein HPB51_000797 [Rhipicephalus microplus]|uniref:Uncharacterized protein n=1 Tax=Rhipicephalus microplus TaxID=6941 RepID=A0A9J6EJM1_RHIMP|nr:hypothetical protein HPB51_000797 [Rhipicephalus microplus]
MTSWPPLHPIAITVLVIFISLCPSAIVIKEEKRQQRHRVSESFNKTTTPWELLKMAEKESKPIVAPPTLVLGADNACAVSSSGSRIVLRPSALAFQAEKLKQTSGINCFSG